MTATTSKPVTRTQVALTALAVFMAVSWVAAIVACLLTTSPLALAFWSVCGIVNGICAFDVATHAVEARVKGW